MAQDPEAVGKVGFLVDTRSNHSSIVPHLTSAFPQAFIQYYYQLFEGNRAALATLYQDGSMLTFEGQKFRGPAIVGKLTSLPFSACKVNCITQDFQPSVSGGVMVFVTGNIIVSG